jgi:hypothetical protein
MSANLQENVLFKLWQNMEGDIFRAHPTIQSRIDAQSPVHLNGHRLELHYLFDATWSAAFRKKLIKYKGRSMKPVEAVKALTREIIGNRPFLWSGNTKIRDNFFAGFRNAHRINNSPHGQNCYQDHFDNAVYLTSLNLAPQFIKFFENFGISADELTDTLTHAYLYQMVMRTSLRDPDADGICKVIVPTKQMAEAFAKNFADVVPISHCDQVEVLKINNGRPTVNENGTAMTGNERVRKFRLKQKTKLSQQSIENITP